MNRKQKLIISVTGLFLVLLILMGLTYAYFLTRITGNDKGKSIGISTANLALVYGDDDGSIIGDGEIIEPGVTFETKTFSVTNEGNEKTGYVVVIEDVNVTWATDGTYTDEEGNQVSYNAGMEVEEGFKSNDFIYTLECESGCNGVEDAILPMKDGILIGNTIGVGETQTYSFTLTYKDTKIDQSEDMNKVLSGRLNIEDINKINPYKDNKNTLAYNIINNAIGLTEEDKGLGYAELVASPPTKVAKEISGETESVLSIAHDDYGISYYYRGNIENNYLEFNNMCWRIVRIEGDGSVKITLAAQKKCSEITSEDTSSAFIGTGQYGYRMIKVTNSNGQQSTNNKYIADYAKSLTGTNTSMRMQLDTWLTSSGIGTNKLKKDDWCLGNITDAYDKTTGELLNKSVNDLKYDKTAFYYASSKRLHGIGSIANAMLRCSSDNNVIYTSYIAALTADEVAFAGGTWLSADYNYYLTDNAKNSALLKWSTLSPSFSENQFGHDMVFTVMSSGALSNGYVSDLQNIRPVITLISNSLVSGGNGTISNPYVVE